MQFKQFLAEEKNVHMEHLDDLPFNEGVEGMRRAINTLRGLRDMLAGNSASRVNATVKWDGAPAIFAGIDPRDGKFFVAKKGVFNATPAIYKTEAEIDVDTTGDLATKLKVALAEFKKLGIKSGVYQGDIMFTSDTLKKQEIDGQQYITFHPNTIVYAVAAGSAEAAAIKRAKIGVVWHTTYTGASFDTMTASFGKPIVPTLKRTSSVWMVDATYDDYSGLATFTKQETDNVTSLLSRAGTLFNHIDARALNDIRATPEFVAMIKQFNNTKVRAGTAIADTGVHVTELFHWMFDRLQAEVDSKKTERGRQTAIQKRDAIVGWFAKHDKKQLVLIYDVIQLLVQAKIAIIQKMNMAAHLGMATFIKKTGGIQSTGAEGFVAIDRMTGGAVKIVDRMEFSRNNFSSDVIKGWTK